MKKMILMTCLAAGLCAGQAMAMPNIKVSYLQQTGTATVGAPIEMWVNITSDGMVSNDLGAPFGLAPSDLPRFGSGFDPVNFKWYQLEFAKYTSVSVGASYSCTPTCDVPGYTFNTYYGKQFPSFFGSSQETLRTGDFLVGSFIPDDKQAMGHTVFPVVPSIYFNVHGESAGGKQLTAYVGQPNGFQACSQAQTPACSFSRDILAVPEASTLSMALVGLLALGVRRAIRHRPGANVSGEVGLT